MKPENTVSQRNRAVRMLLSVRRLGISVVDIQKVEEMQGGLFNLVLRIQTSKGTFFYKKCLADSRSGLFQMPDIHPTFRAGLEYRVQEFASSLSGCVPKVLAFYSDDASLIMTAVPDSTPLIEWIENGNFEGLQLSKVFEFLAEFHSESAKSRRLMGELANPTFRDFKLGLQYEDTARKLPRRESEIVLGCLASYKSSHECVTYGDMNSRNILISRSEKLPYMIDFDQAHIGSRGYDLAYILSEFFISAQFHKNPDIVSYMIEMLDVYFARTYSYKRDLIESQISNHLAVQVIYRFMGPSRHSWTHYVDEQSKPSIIASATHMLAEDPRPVTLFLKEQFRGLSYSGLNS